MTTIANSMKRKRHWGRKALFWCAFTSLQLSVFMGNAYGAGQNLPPREGKVMALPSRAPQGKFLPLNNTARNTRSAKVFALNGAMRKNDNLRDLRARTPKAEEVSNEVKLAMLTRNLPKKDGQKVMDEGEIAAAIAPLFKEGALMASEAHGEIDPTEDDGVATDIVLKDDLKKDWQKEVAAVADEYVWPLAKTFTRISSPFGTRVHPVTHQTAFHAGIDIPAPKGTEVSAARAGEVTAVGTHPRLGNYVKITHDDGAYTLYGHLQKATIAQGVKVAAGQPIGLVGSTGRSTGPHLDFSIRKDGKPVNPMAYLKQPDKNDKQPVLALKD